MAAIISRLTVDNWFIDVYCTDLHRASATDGEGCGTKIRFFASDFKYQFFGSGMDNAGDIYPCVTCPNCHKILLLHDREVPSHVAVAIKKGNVPHPNPEIMVDATADWEIQVTCGGNRKKRPSNSCGQTFTVKATDIVCGFFGADFQGADGKVKYYSDCPHCGRRKFLKIPPFIEEDARIRGEIASPRRR